MRMLVVGTFLLTNIAIWVYYGISSLWQQVDSELPVTLIEILPYINFFLGVNALAAVYFFRVTRQTLKFSSSWWTLVPVLVFIGAGMYMLPGFQLTIPQSILMVLSVIAVYLPVSWLPTSSKAALRKPTAYSNTDFAE